MNQFIYAIKVDGHIIFGTFQSQDGASARKFLQDMYEDRKIEAMSFKGVSSKSFDFDVLEIK